MHTISPLPSLETYLELPGIEEEQYASLIPYMGMKPGDEAVAALTVKGLECGRDPEELPVMFHQLKGIPDKEIQIHAICGYLNPAHPAGEKLSENHWCDWLGIVHTQVPYFTRLAFSMWFTDRGADLVFRQSSVTNGIVSLKQAAKFHATQDELQKSGYVIAQGLIIQLVEFMTTEEILNFIVERPLRNLYQLPKLRQAGFSTLEEMYYMQDSLPAPMLDELLS